MSQYIPIFMDDVKENYSINFDPNSNYQNFGLYDIIAYIGEKSHKRRNNAVVSKDEYYKIGKKYINSKLHKWNLTAIEKLVRADKKSIICNYDERQLKIVWKIHKYKAQKIFKVIFEILQEYNNPEIIQLFNKICNRYHFTSGTDATGHPYYRVISDDNLLGAQKYTGEERKALKKCANNISKFAFYH